MGIGRREFLRAFSGVLSGLATSASPAVAIFENLYLNRKLGLAFEKPAGWHFASVMDMGTMISGQLLDMDDVELEKDIKEMSDLPIVTVSHDPLNSTNTFTPGINIYHEKYPADDDVWEIVQNDPLVACETDAEIWPNVLKNYSTVSGPVRTEVPGCAAGEYTASFLFEHVGLREPVEVRMRTIVILQCPTWYTLRMYDSPSLGGKFEFDFSQFVATLKIL